MRVRAVVAARDEMRAELGLDLVIIARPLVYVMCGTCTCMVHAWCMHGACMVQLAACWLQPWASQPHLRGLTAPLHTRCSSLAAQSQEQGEPGRAREEPGR